MFKELFVDFMLASVLFSNIFLIDSSKSKVSNFLNSDTIQNISGDFSLNPNALLASYKNTSGNLFLSTMDSSNTSGDDTSLETSGETLKRNYPIFYENPAKSYNNFIATYVEEYGYDSDYTSVVTSGETSIVFDLVKKYDFAEKVLRQKDYEYVAVAIGGDFCKYCKKMAPKLKEVSKEFPNIKFYDVDVRYEDAISDYYSVDGYPTVILFKDGNEVARSEYNISTDEIRRLLNGENFYYSED